MTDVLAYSGAARAMSAEAARLAGRLGALLATLGEGHALEDARVFLERMAVDHSASEPTEPLARITAALGLTPLERDLVILAGLPDEHEGYAGVLRRLHPEGRPRPTAGLAAQLLGEEPDTREELRATLASGAAVRHELLVLGGDGPLPERTLELPPLLWAELSGVAPALPHAAVDEPAIAGLEAWLSAPDARRAIRALLRDERCTVLVTAQDGEPPLAWALALAVTAGRDALAARPPAAGDAGVLALHALARGAVPVLAVGSPEPGHAPPPAPLGEHPGTVILCARPGALAAPRTRPLLTLRAEPLDTFARRAMWAGVLPELADQANELAARNVVDPGVARRVAADVRARAALDQRAPELADVVDSVRSRSSGVLPAGIVMRHPRAGWDRLVLPADRLAELRSVADRLRHQTVVLDEWGFLRDRPGARGVRVLFSGPPGTGKTLASEVLAHALDRELMVVDISRVLSKWIGETEQRLAEVFDAAEHAQSVLLFDEADALFGKRTDVSDAHDRYANLETAYLLQRLERFEGLAILATNLRNNIDDAFTRRLEFVVEFDEPGFGERIALWAAHVPSEAPIAPDLDYAELAGRYPLVGGAIRNAAVAAAFLAAAEEVPIAREHVLRALEREYDKHGRAFPGRPPDALAA